MLKLERPILFMDFETTGVDPVKDRIVEMGVSGLQPDGSVKPHSWTCRFNPGIPIPAEATECHGITDADVAECRPFSDYAAMIHQKMQGKDLAGYNISQFDLPMLDEHLRRSGLKIDMTGVRVIDAKTIYFQKEPRDLSAAVRRFCKREHEGAHGAGSDAQASLDVLLGQVAEFEDLAAMTLDELALYSRMSDHEPVDLAGKLYRGEDDFVYFGFGKNVDQRVIDHDWYCGWMEREGFPASTLEELQREWDKNGSFAKPARRGSKR